MNIRQLETFCWAARLGSFARAAQHLNATQSAVSMRIHEVEDRLGTVLFDRSQRVARLTPEGASLLPYAEEVLLAMDRLIDAAAPEGRQIAGYVRLGVTENIAVTWLAAMIKDLKLRHPLIQIELEIGVSHVLEDRLYDRSLDMILAACELPASKFHSLRLQSVDFRWMCSPDLANVPKLLTPENLADLPIISVTREWQARGTLLGWFTSNKVHYRNVTICNTFRTAASMALDGLGLAQLPVELFRKEVQDGRLRILPAEPEIPPLDIMAIRPLTSDSPIFRAIEEQALRAAGSS